MKVLLVEDSKHLRTYLSIALKRAGYAVDTAADGEAGWWHIESFAYDVVILDIMLPKRDGMSLLRELRCKEYTTPVLLLTAKDQIKDKVNGLQAGADDYLIKPFDISELTARVQALTRRTYDQRSPIIKIGEFSINTATKTVYMADDHVSLTSREYQILEYLTRRLGEVVSRQEIEDHIYDAHAEIMSNVVNSTISLIRKKLTKHGLSELIQTRRGLGYSIDK